MDKGPPAAVSSSPDTLQAISAGMISSFDYPVFSVDKKYGYTSFNGRHAAVMKTLYNADISLGRSIIDYMSVEADRSAAGVNLDRALCGEQFTVEAYSGDIKYGRLCFEVKHIPVRSALEEISGVLVIAKDVTEQRANEEVLLRQRSLLSTIIESSSEAIFAKDRAGRYQIINAAGARMLGCTAADVIGRTDAELLPAETAHEFRKTDNYVMSGGQSYEREEYGLIDGIARVFLAHKTPWRDESGQIAGVIGVSNDITERKQIESVHEQLLSAIEQAGESIIITDTTGMIRYVNPTFERVTGYAREEAIGNNPRMLKSGQQDETFYLELWETVSQGRIWKGRLLNRKKDGSLFTEDATISPVYDKTGKIVSYVAVKRDISEQLNAYREKELLREQLLQSQKMEAVGTLAGGIAHDFNNILNIIIGYGSLLRSPADGIHKDTDKDSAYLDEIIAAAQRASTMTQGLLAFSRKTVQSLKPINLNDVVSSMNKMVHRLIGEDIEVHLDLAVRDLVVMADYAQIEQVLLNLAANAKDAMPFGGALDIRTRVEYLDRRSPGADEVTMAGWFGIIEVSDSGQGIDEATQKKIFEPFFTTKEVGRGTGLGLSIVYGIVKQHKGFIFCSSSPGKGATFTIYLPLLSATAAAEERPGNIHAVQGGTETILLAEDDAASLRLISIMLKGFGYRVVAAADGEEAVKQFHENSGAIDLLLLDVIMPKMNGLNVLKSIRQTDKDVKALFMSGYDAGAMEKKGIGRDFEYITKPVSPHRLLRTVRSILDGERSDHLERN